MKVSNIFPIVFCLSLLTAETSFSQSKPSPEVAQAMQDFATAMAKQIATAVEGAKKIEAERIKTSEANKKLITDKYGILQGSYSACYKGYNCFNSDASLEDSKPTLPFYDFDSCLLSENPSCMYVGAPATIRLRTIFYTGPSKDYPISFSAEAGDVVEYLNEVMVVKNYASGMVLQSGEHEEYEGVPAEEEVKVMFYEGDPIYYLYSAQELGYVFWYKGKRYAGGGANDTATDIDEQIKTEAWFRVKSKNGNKVGWGIFLFEEENGLRSFVNECC